MKLKEIAQKYNIDEIDFDRFLMIKQMPYKSTFSGPVIPDEKVDEYVKAFHAFEEEMRIKREQNASNIPVPAIIQELRAEAKRLGALFFLSGARGRTIFVGDRRCTIKTSVTVGSVISGNATDGEKTIFYKDCAGIQFKESGLTLGYLQLETPSMQMNNQSSNFFSENTFTFDESTTDTSNKAMREVYYFIMDRIEKYKYESQVEPVTELPAELAKYVKML
jgi:hypothetical protein